MHKVFPTIQGLNNVSFFIKKNLCCYKEVVFVGRHTIVELYHGCVLIDQFSLNICKTTMLTVTFFFLNIYEKHVPKHVWISFV